MQVRPFVRTCAVLAAIVALSVRADAQAGLVLSGRLVNSVSGDPVAGAIVVIEELRRDVTSDAQGAFVFDNVPAGTYHLFVQSDGFSSRRTEVVLPGAAAPLEVRVDPELHFEDVVSVSPNARSQLEAYQPTTVLAGQELAKVLASTIGETLQYQPGVTTRSAGPATARPVVRGLDGDRVLLLQDGQRTGDLSSASGDHGATINPAAATRIEIVRGPATLLYGANAIGGIVNVITDEIPSTPQTGVGGHFTLDAGSASREGGAAGDVHAGNGSVALHLGGGGRRSGDLATPEGRIGNSQSRNGFGTIGLAWTGARGYIGGSYGYDDSQYGIPAIEGGAIQLTPRRHAVTLRGEARQVGWGFQSLRATVAVRKYEHEELNGSVVETLFSNDTTEVEIRGSHRTVGRLAGSVGGWVSRRAFDTQGEEALAPRIDQRGAALFVFEEAEWPHVTIQFGGRVDHVRFEPAAEPSRTFTAGSFSTGVLFRPAAARDSVTVAASLARAVRTPSLEELFFIGPHHGNLAFEIGNPDLDPERALGFDVSLRWRSSRVSGEVTWFRNDIDGYIFRSPLTEEELEAREALFAARFPGRTIEHEGHGHGEGDAPFPIIEYVGADAVLQGVEAHADVRVLPPLLFELGLDYVRGALAATDEPLPRIPPLRLRGGLRYQRDALQFGAEMIGTADQGRVFGAETPTAGAALLKLHAAWSFVTGSVTNTITARVDNATNELYRSHLSLIKALVPERGRDVRVVYDVSF